MSQWQHDSSYHLQAAKLCPPIQPQGQPSTLESSASHQQGLATTDEAPQSSVESDPLRPPDHFGTMLINPLLSVSESLIQLQQMPRRGRNSPSQFFGSLGFHFFHEMASSLHSAYSTRSI
jgi:hypothetical protein